MALCCVLQEVHDSLISVEVEAERLYASERGTMDADSQSRDRLYQRAQAVRRGGPGSAKLAPTGAIDSHLEGRSTSRLLIADVQTCAIFAC